MLVWCPKPAGGSTGGGTSPGTGTGPSIGNVTTKSHIVGTATTTMSIPSVIAVGELMLLICTGYKNVFTTPSGWTVQQIPTDPDLENIYVYSRIKVSGDSSITITRTEPGNSAVMALIGIKDGKTVHKNAAPLEGTITTTGTTAPAVSNTIAPALDIWMAASFSTSSADVTWSPDKPRVVAVAGDVSYTYYNYLSIVSKLQTAVGSSEATTVSVDPSRGLAAMHTLSITA